MADLTTIFYTPDAYLDARMPTWEPFERGGLVRYDPFARMIRVSSACTEIVH